MKKTIEYLRNLKDDVSHALEQEDSSIQVDSNDLRHINEAFDEIQREQKKFENLCDELIHLANNYRNGHMGEQKDSYLVDGILAILKRDKT